jgi:NAD(P)-dependent dehydrogenase (short-subunit alcohol dehydrogenase family)
VSEIDFSGQVALVTGAARGLGASHARELARRGAAVVLADLGDDAGHSRAEALASEIRAGGGQAHAAVGDVADTTAARALVEIAYDRFDRLDALVHNAGLTVLAAEEQGAAIPPGFDDDHEVSDRRQLDVNLLSALHLVRAAWPGFVEAGYGRIVLTSSGAVFGIWELAAYAAAKAGLISLARSAALASADARADIRTNVIAPSAATGTRHAANNERSGGRLTTTSPTSMVVLLASAACPVNGECFRVAGGFASRVVLSSSHGWVGSSEITAEETMAAMPAILGSPDELQAVESVPQLAELMQTRMREELDTAH